MDRLLTVVVGRRHQCAGATSAFSPYIISFVIGRRCRRARAISAISLTSASFLGVVRHGICGLFEWSSIDRLTSARSLGRLRLELGDLVFITKKIAMGRRRGNSLEPLQSSNIISSLLIITSSRDRTTLDLRSQRLSRPGQLELIALPKFFFPPHRLFPSLTDKTHTCGIGLGNQLLAWAADVKAYNGKDDVT